MSIAPRLAQGLSIVIEFRQAPVHVRRSKDDIQLAAVWHLPMTTAETPHGR
jgi:hypothetical protein